MRAGLIRMIHLRVSSANAITMKGRQLFMLAAQEGEGH